MSSAVMYKSATNRTSKGTRKASEAEKITETYNSYKVKTRGRGPSREGAIKGGAIKGGGHQGRVGLKCATEAFKPKLLFMSLPFLRQEALLYHPDSYHFATRIISNFSN